MQHPNLLSTGDPQEAFPAVRELDLRQMPPLRCHAPYFASLTSLRRIYISSLQRSAEPKVLLSELREFATALQVWPLAVPSLVWLCEFKQSVKRSGLLRLSLYSCRSATLQPGLTWSSVLASLLCCGASRRCQTQTRMPISKQSRSCPRTWRWPPAAPGYKLNCQALFSAVSVVGCNAISKVVLFINIVNQGANSSCVAVWQVTMLHMPQLCYAISAAGLAAVMRLTNLRHLRLVTYGAHIMDADFCCLAGDARIFSYYPYQLGPRVGLVLEPLNKFCLLVRHACQSGNLAEVAACRLAIF